MTVRQRAAGRRWLAVAYRGAFYVLAATPAWGAAAMVVIVCHRTHIA